MTGIPADSAPDDSRALRDRVIAAAREMNRSGINVNKSGNVSARCSRGGIAGLIITPTGIDYDALGPDDLVFVRLDDGGCSGRWKPSSEWRFHRDILRSRPEFGAVVHTHSPAATALAVHGQGIPAFHYMVAAAGGDNIRCAEYATFGTQALSDRALAALAGRRACLLAHHGVISCGPAVADALALAVEVENLARTYLAARVLGEPPRLSTAEMQRVIEKFRDYVQVDSGGASSADAP